MKNFPRPTGQLQGDDKAMPDKGTMTGVTDTYGGNLSPEAINRVGGISGSTGSDGMSQDKASK